MFFCHARCRLLRMKCLLWCITVHKQNRQVISEGAIAVFHDQRYVAVAADEDNITGGQRPVARHGSDSLRRAVAAFACGDTGMAAAVGDFGG